MAKDIGVVGEEIAEKFLRRKGYKILARNYRIKGGEIDIVAKDGKTMVFVEVKTRRGEGFGLPQESVTRDKMRRIAKAAKLYLLSTGLGEGVLCRFDVVAVNLEDGVSIEHIRDAFSLDDISPGEGGWL
jgi:putative endonuclease